MNTTMRIIQLSTPRTSINRGKICRLHFNVYNSLLRLYLPWLHHRRLAELLHYLFNFLMETRYTFIISSDGYQVYASFPGSNMSYIPRKLYFK